MKSYFKFKGNTAYLRHPKRKFQIISSQIKKSELSRVMNEFIHELKNIASQKV